MNQPAIYHHVKLIVFGLLRQYYSDGFTHFELASGSNLQAIKKALLDDLLLSHPHLDKTYLNELLASCAFAHNDNLITSFILTDA